MNFSIRIVSPYKKICQIIENFLSLLLPVCHCGNLTQNWLLQKSQYPELGWCQFIQKGLVNQK